MSPSVAVAEAAERPEAASAVRNAVSVGARSVTPSEADGNRPPSLEPDSAEMAWLKMLRSVWLARVVLKVVTHGACSGKAKLVVSPRA